MRSRNDSKISNNCKLAKKKNNNNKDKKHFQLKYNFNDKMFSLFSLA